MCLHVFCNGNDNKIEELKDPAQKLGAAFQKVNFLRDLKDDYQGKGRLYFPELNKKIALDNDTKTLIEKQIENDFDDGIEGINKLPNNSRLGVYLAYRYYTKLLKKLIRTTVEKLMINRIRVSNLQKLLLFPSALAFTIFMRKTK